MSRPHWIFRVTPPGEHYAADDPRRHCASRRRGVYVLADTDDEAARVVGELQPAGFEGLRTVSVRRWVRTSDPYIFVDDHSPRLIAEPWRPGDETGDTGHDDGR